MERIQQCKNVAVESTQQLQKTLEAKDYGHLSTGVAAGLMLVVFCPMSIIAVADAYWTYSVDVHGATVSTAVSLWTVSSSTEIGGKGTDSEMDMCGETMQSFDDCGKIHALRFFTITALFLSLASASMLLTAFLPCLKDKALLREKIRLVGASLAPVVLLWDFLSMCIAAGVDMGEGYSLSGAGFVFIILELLFVILAVVALATKTMRQGLPTVVTVVRKPSGAENEKENPRQAFHGQTAPTLLGVLPTAQSSIEMDKKKEQPEVTRDDNCSPTVVVAGVSGQFGGKSWEPH
mmetsp:Transcript_22719/g.41414  ORF Transcript_22719/g.41414 Transcript_22719/m.41414 type:complete len:292 (+) Transcript_22719:81-956(+)